MGARFRAVGCVRPGCDPDARDHETGGAGSHPAAEMEDRAQSVGVNTDRYASGSEADGTDLTFDGAQRPPAGLNQTSPKQPLSYARGSVEAIGCKNRDRLR